MHSLKAKLAVALSGVAVALLFLAAPTVKGGDWNLKTFFTVSHPFTVPGKVLEPNTRYVLRLLDLSGTRNVVQIFNEDQSELLTTFMAASAQRLETEDDTVFEFIEVDAGYPKPIRTWFYPGRLDGKEFIYPKDQAEDIVAHSREGVLTAEGRVHLHDLETFEVVAQDPDDVMTETRTAQITTATDTDDLDTDTDVTREKPTAIEPTEVDETVVTQEPEISEPAQTVQEDADMEDEIAVDPDSEETLPRTDGQLPLIGLIGVLCLGLGLGVRAFSTRS